MPQLTKRALRYLRTDDLVNSDHGKYRSFFVVEKMSNINIGLLFMRISVYDGTQLTSYTRALIKFIYSFLFVHYKPTDGQTNMYNI